MELALLPVLYVRKGVVWIADDMPELEKTGELLVQLKAARTCRWRAAYKWGVLYLRGDAAIERDPLAALEWLRRSAEHGDRRGQCALATLLQTGEGVADADGAALVRGGGGAGCSTARLALGEELLRDARAALTRRKDLAAAARGVAAADEHFAVAAAAGNAHALAWRARAAELRNQLATAGGARAPPPARRRPPLPTAPAASAAATTSTRR